MVRRWMPDEGGAEGGQDIAHKGCMCCSCFILRADGGLHLSRRQPPDLLDREDRAQVRRGGGVRPSVWRNDLRLLPAVQVEPPRR